MPAASPRFARFWPTAWRPTAPPTIWRSRPTPFRPTWSPGESSTGSRPRTGRINPDASWFTDTRGELAALATAFSWTASALAFTAAAVRLGSLSLNIIRLALALAFFVALEWLLRGLPLPTDAAPHNWLWLSISGLIGFTLGDLCLFRAFVLIGPRRTMLIAALVPMVGAVISWVALDEGLSALAIAGMVLTMAGVAWVLLERPAAAV